ncbi:SPRY domain-containing SOCS box protein 3-like isoform X2 [Ptychodera flava]|uniref:SPRY domain-containing SOCS box protein 3-like isoform X2 n=1 Tax=Ptychodera flava TaxID=63121 RepID=UPI00396A8B0D
MGQAHPGELNSHQFALTLDQKKATLNRLKKLRLVASFEVEWQWEAPKMNVARPAGPSNVKCENREVWFHREYSCGTAAVRGSQPITEGQHYWEIKMMSPVYGTDMMIGVGTSDLDLNKCTHKFCSLLGQDSDSWGLSYTGCFQHDGASKVYCPKFGQNAVIGVHLDMWAGTLSYYKNGQPLGVAARGLQGKKLYPVVCSTAARTGMKIVKTRSFPSSLQFLCCEALRKCIPQNKKVLSVLELPPGLRHFLQDNLSWLLETTVNKEKVFETCTTGTQTNITFHDIRHVRGSQN